MSDASADLAQDDERVRVTRWTFPLDGDATGMHTHELPYVVVPVTGGTFRVVAADGSSRDMVQKAGEPYVREAGATHDVVNASGRPAMFVEVELKP